MKVNTLRKTFKYYDLVLNFCKTFYLCKCSTSFQINKLNIQKKKDKVTIKYLKTKK